jgi:hypothetical protein
MACCLGVEVGVYTQFTNNLHVYENNWKPEEWLAKDWYKTSGYPELGPKLVKDPSTFDSECAAFVDKHHGIVGAAHTYSDPGYSEPFLRDVAWPMCAAFMAYKDKNYDRALRFIWKVEAEDWSVAGHEWIQRRLVKKGMKADGSK